MSGFLGLVKDFAVGLVPRGRAAGTLPAPQFLFVHVNKRCNLRCQHCEYWHNDDRNRNRYLRGERMSELLGEFAQMSPAGKVVLCGGEMLLDLEDVFAITTACRRLGLRALGVTNGTLIGTPELAERLVSHGPHEISISLNSHRRDLHDRTRGVLGTYDKAVRALHLLLDARSRLGVPDTRIHAMGLVFDGNYRELEEFYDFVLNSIGADKLKLNFLQPTFGHDGPGDRFFVEHSRIDPDALLAVIDRCDRRFGLGLNPAWKADVAMYYQTLARCPDPDNGWSSRNGTPRPLCNSHERNIMVDHLGFARLCFSHRFRGTPLRRKGDLRRFWQRAGSMRRKMQRCRLLCGISHSVRRETSTLASRRSVTGSQIR